MSNQLRLDRFEKAGEPDFLAQVKSALDMPVDAELVLQNVEGDAAGSLSVEYAVTLPVELRGKEFGVADGVSVDEQVVALLKFDARGVLISSRITPIDERHFRLVKDNIKKLAATNAIYLARSGEEIDTEVLRAQHKPWYVETDERARKRLKRAYMA